MRIRAFASLFLVFLSSGATFAQDAAPVKSDVWLPGKPWALELDSTGFTTKANEMQPDGRRYFLAEDTKTRFIVSVYLEASKGPVRPGECKRSLEEKAKRNAALASVELKGVGYR